MKFLWQLVPLGVVVMAAYGWVHDWLGARTWVTEWFTESVLRSIGG